MAFDALRAYVNFRFRRNSPQFGERDQLTPTGRTLRQKIDIDKLRSFRAPIWSSLSIGTRARLKRAFGVSVLAAIVAALGYRILELDLVAVWANLPSAPLFYILFAVRFFTLPLADWLSFSLIWKRDLRRHFLPFLYKKVLNTQIVGHSGDIQLSLWAKRTLGIPITSTILAAKDVTILSAAATNPIAIAAAGYLFFFSDVGLFRSLDPAVLATIAAFLAAGAIATLGAFAFRSRILSVDGRTAIRLFGVQIARAVAVLVLLAAMWTAAQPGTRMTDWVVFVLVDLIVTRLPPLPGRQFVFLAASLQMTEVAPVPEQAAAALFIVYTGLMVLGDVAAAGVYHAVSSLGKKPQPATAPPAPEVPATAIAAADQTRP